MNKTKKGFELCRTAAVCGVLALSAGCAAIRDARVAQKTLGNGEKVVRFEETGLPSDRPIAMPELENVALLYNPAVSQARQAVILAQLAVRDIDASYIPVIDASAGYTLSTSNTEFDGGSFSMDGEGSIGLTLNMLVYDFGRTRAAAREAVAELSAAERDARSAELQAVYNVRKACFDLKRAVELNAVAEDSVAQYAEHLKQTRDRFDVGTVNSYAVTKAEFDWNNSILELVTTSNNVKTAAASLNLAMGFAEYPVYEVGECSVDGYDGVGIEDLMNIARTNSPALASAVASAEAAGYYVDRMIAEFFPSLSAGIDFSAGGGSFPLVWNTAIGGSVVQSVFSAGRRGRDVERAVAQLRIARSKAAEAELDLYNKLTVAVLDSERASRQLEVAMDSERMAEENYRIVSENYNVGRASELERSDAQLALYSARAASVSARYDWFDSQIAISLLIGD